jgi:hypothetical protein
MKPGFHRVRLATGRNETGIPLRQNALDPGFHDVPLVRLARIVMPMVPV